MVNKKNNVPWTILIIIAIIVFTYGGCQGWFKTIVNLPAPIEVAPDISKPLINSCDSLCTQQNFDNSYSQSGDCREGEYKVTYGYPGQNPLLECCCYDNVPIVPPSDEEEMGYRECYNSDYNNDFLEELQFAGFCTDTEGTYSDYCTNDGMLIEYYCGPLMETNKTCLNTEYGCAGMLENSAAYCENDKCIIPASAPPADSTIPLTAQECANYADSLGKEYNAIGFANIDACGGHAWDHCEINGKTLKYFDYMPPNCCVWTCQ